MCIVESGETSRNSREQSVTDRNGEDKNDSNDIDPSVCSNCGQFVSIRKETPCGKLCTTCNLYFQKNGCMRPHQAVHHAATRKCPPEMTAVVSEFRRFAHVIVEGKKSEDSDPKEIYLGRKYVIDEDLQKIQRSMLEIRSSIARAERTMTDFDFRLKDREVDKYRKIAASVTKPCATSRVREQWTQREMTVAFHLLVLHGNNHSRIASCLRTKTAAHVREFAEKYSQELQEAIVKQEAEDCAEPPGSAAEGDTSDDGESENGCSEVGV
uniref:C2H2-type domain-containing protein n=1 Tax=Steinernema glaseri TaxID=37863 RepID=A0A1I7ZV86_9BILA